MAAATTVPREEPARQRSLREHNLGLVLRSVALSPHPVSRADLADTSGLTKATISALVDELLGGGLLAEVDPAPRAGAGRPAVGLVVSAEGLVGLGLEVNVDYLAACVVDLSGTQRRLQVRRGDLRGLTPNRVLGDLARLAADVTAEAERDGLRVAGIALGVPGLVADGVVRLAPNLGWRDIDVVAALRARWPLTSSSSAGASNGGPATLTVDNEANLAALAELHAATEARPSFVYVSGEVGVGAGVVIEGRLLRGARGYGGELGHVTIHPDGADCRCGARGCLEAYANQDVLFRSAGLEGVEPSRRLETVVERATAGHQRTLGALADVGRALGIAAAGVVNLLDVDAIVLGGIYAPLTPWLAEPISRELAERAITAPWAPVAVRASSLGTTAAVVGAAGSVIRAIRDAPAAWLSR